MGEFTSIRNNLYIHHCDLQQNLQLEPVLDEMRALKALTAIQLEDIAACMKPTEKIDRLLHILHDAPEESLSAFVNSLQHSGQVPLQMLVTGHGKLMTAAHKEALEKHRVAIADNLYSTVIIPYLRQVEVLNQYDKDMLDAESNNALKNRRLVDILLKKCDLAYYQFVHGLVHLEPHHRHIADVLEPDGCEYYRNQIGALTVLCEQMSDKNKHLVDDNKHLIDHNKHLSDENYQLRHENELLIKKMEQVQTETEEDRPKRMKRTKLHGQENVGQNRRRRLGCVRQPSLSNLDVNSLNKTTDSET